LAGVTEHGIELWVVRKFPDVAERLSVDEEGFLFLGPATSHLDTGFSWSPCVYKQMLRWFPRFQVATTCSPSRLKFISNQFHILYTCKITTTTG